MKKEDLPRIIPVFPLSNFIFFPRTAVPLNIFEPRYIQMIDDCMKGNRLLGIVQPSRNGDLKKPDLHDVGCLGKINSFSETEDKRYLIVLNGICRYKIDGEAKSEKMYRQCNVNYESFLNDLEEDNSEIKIDKVDPLLKNLKNLFRKQGYMIDLKDLENQSLNQAINALSMASPFSLEEKQILLETKNISLRKKKLEEILKTYMLDQFSNKTIQ